MIKPRVLTALVLTAGFIAVLFALPPLVVGLIFLLVALLSAWEWGGFLSVRARSRGLFVALVAFSCLGLWSFSEKAFPFLWGIAALFWIFLVPVWLIRGWKSERYGYLIGWLVLVPTWAAAVGLHARAPELLLATMALVWAADVSAYYVGRAWGRHKLAPAISPGKTWEGAAGGLAGVFLYALALASFLPQAREMGVLFFLFLLCLLGTLSVAGDLLESLMKRQAGLKDSGNLLPGHGGFLDRIDGQTSTLPFAALGVHWLGS